MERTRVNHITSLLLMGSESTVHENTLVQPEGGKKKKKKSRSFTTPHSNDE